MPVEPELAPGSETPAKAAAGRSAHERVFYSGVFMLVAGLIGAALIYALSPDDAGTGGTVDFANRRAYEYQIERIGGMATVYAVRFNDWFAGLWHGRRLAFTVAMLAIVIALGCFWVADRMSPPASAKGDDGDGS